MWPMSNVQDVFLLSDNFVDSGIEIGILMVKWGWMMDNWPLYQSKVLTLPDSGNYPLFIQMSHQIPTHVRQKDAFFSTMPTH